MRELTIGEQRLLSRALRASATLVHSDNIAPADVNILPMGYVVDTEAVDRCVAALVEFGERNLARMHDQHVSDPTFAHEIVITVLQAAAMDIGRGSAKHSESETGGPDPGTSSGADHARTPDE